MPFLASCNKNEAKKRILFNVVPATLFHQKKYESSAHFGFSYTIHQMYHDIWDFGEFTIISPIQELPFSEH